MRILRSETDERLTFRTAGSSNRVKDVRYEVKLRAPAPAGDRLERLERAAVEPERSLSINVRRGNIDLAGVGGTVSTHTMKGHTSIALDDSDPDEAQVFSGINGDIELRLKHGTNAELKAETIDGDIEAAASLGLDVQKRAAGHNAVGRLGKGGEPILVRRSAATSKSKDER